MMCPGPHSTPGSPGFATNERARQRDTVRRNSDSKIVLMHALHRNGFTAASTIAMTRHFVFVTMLIAAGAIAAASCSHACGVKPQPAGPEVSVDGAPHFMWPVRGLMMWDMCSDGSERRFKGIDIAVREGTKVLAAADGVVAYAGDELKGFGNIVIIRHDGGWATAYAYVGSLLVKRGNVVRRGRPIALSGRSVALGTPLLHFEIRKRSSPVDPLRVLPRRRDG